MKKISILWITDPWATLDHPKDTTLRLMEECLHLGVNTYWCDVKSIRWQLNSVVLTAHKLLDIKPDRKEKSFDFSNPALMQPKQFQSIQYRPDPPVDLAYLHPLQLLALGIDGMKGVEIINPPEVLALANEKLEAALLGDLMPPSVASSQWETLLNFGKREYRTVLKPLHNAQSKDVELLDWRTEDSIAEALRLIIAATQSFERPVILQRFLEGIREGEQRLWFLDGKLLAYCRKEPLSGDFRINIDRGSKLVKSVLNRREKLAANKISKHLRARKIRLAAVDLIEGCVTDFNFTSPGLIVQMENVLCVNLARTIIKSLC